MPKDTKSSGYNKAPACESRGFGHKKEGENFDTPSCQYECCPLGGRCALQGDAASRKAHDLTGDG